MHDLRHGAKAVGFEQWLDRYLAEFPTLYDYDRIHEDLQRFPSENVFMYFYEDATRSPRDFATALYKFLGVASDFVPPSLHRPINARYEFRSRRAHLLLLECLFRIYNKSRTRRMVSSPHLRPRWVDLLLRANQKNLEGHSISTDEMMLARDKTRNLCRRFVRAFGKQKEWGYL